MTDRTSDTTHTAAHDERTTATFADQQIGMGPGGDTHQTAGGDTPELTTQQGAPVSDDQNSLKVGERGPTLLEDQHFREKIFHFDHERIPERVVHARGFGAHGFFETYESLADITRADLFQRAGARTKAFVRFSTVAGNTGSFDLARDVHGFAVKLYTQQGNAVALLPSKEGADLLADDATARDFVSDACAHLKFIGYVDAAAPLLDKAGVAGDLDGGCIAFDGDVTPTTFVAQCRTLRYWPRELAVDQT